MKRCIYIILGLIFISVSPLFAQENESTAPSASQESSSTEAAPGEAGSQSAEAFSFIPELKSEEESNIDRNRSKLVFKTNVKGCSLYLNGNFRGVSPVSIGNLTEGYYLLRIEKAGYLTQENFVYAEGGKARTFYIELEMDEASKKKAEARAQAAKEREEAAKAKKEAEAQSQETAAAPTENIAQETSETVGDAK